MRFDQMSNYFDAFRIDHILGFFRIWSIPLHAVEGIMGRFVPAIPVDISEFREKISGLIMTVIANHLSLMKFLDGYLVKMPNM